ARQGEWLAGLEQEHGNIRAAITWALDHDQVDVALRTAGAIWTFWQIHGRLSEGRRWKEAASEHPQTVPTPARAKALWGAGALHEDEQYERALKVFQESITLYQQFNASLQIALTYFRIGQLYLDQQADEQAAAAYQAGLDVFPDRTTHGLIVLYLEGMAEFA